MATLYNDNPHAASLLRLAVSGRVPGPTEEDPESKSQSGTMKTPTPST